METLSYADDSFLRERFHHLVSARDSAQRSGYDTYTWDVEIAYLQRETMLREDRRISHERYMKLNPEAVETIDYTSDLS